MRVLMLNYEFPPVGGGAATATKHLLEELSKVKNLKIDVVTCSAGKETVERFSKNITLYRLDIGKKNLHYFTFTEMFRWSLQARKKIKVLLRKNNYDLMHCWFGWPCGFFGYVHRKRLPYIVALRGSDVPGYSKRLRYLDPLFLRSLSRKIWKHARAVTVNSAGLGKLAKKTLNIPMHVVHNGVDTRVFKTKKKKVGKTIQLISSGRLIERKGYPYLIKALKGLDQFSLTLLGDGNRRHELEQLAKKLNVPVVFKGTVKRKNIPRELQKADVFVLPSSNEGMSNAALEAMATGLPLILTDVGGSRELVKGNGVIVPPRSPKALRQALLSLTSKNIEQMGKKSRKRAEDMSWSSVAKKYLKLYKKCAA